MRSIKTLWACIFLLLTCCAAPCSAQFFGNPVSISAGVTNNASLVLVTGQLSSAQIKTLSGTPITAIASPGANHQIQVIGYQVTYNFGTTPYATGTGAITLGYNNGSGGLQNVVTNAVMLASANSYCIGMQGIADSIGVDLSNKDLRFTLGGGGSNFTAGDGTVSYEILYRDAIVNH